MDAMDKLSVYFYGMHRALALIDNDGILAFLAAQDPVPRSSFSSAVQKSDGDPFEDTDRPLVFTISSTCRWLDPHEYHALLGLSRFPGIALDLMPGASTGSYEQVGRVTWRGKFPSYVVSTSRNPNRSSNVSFDPALPDFAGHLWGTGKSVSMRLAIEIEVHGGLGNDYLVSPIAAGNRSRNRNTWPHYMGVCTISEAFRLAGLKSRMYGTVPLVAEPRALYSVNIGAWRDMAVYHFVPQLTRAVGGALSSLGGSADKESLWCLLAVRNLLSDYLIARDMVHRYTSREALTEKSGQQGFRNYFDAGAKGNDLTQLIMYHTLAALNHAYAIGDNLANIVVHQLDPGVNLGQISLPKILGPSESLMKRVRGMPYVRIRDRLWTPNHEMGMIFAARAIRNSIIHREGISYGRLKLIQEEDRRSIRELSAFWLKETDVQHWHSIAHHAEFVDDSGETKMAIMTCRRLIDVLWIAISNMVNGTLCELPWPSLSWLASDPRYHSQAREQALFQRGYQRRLWGLTHQRTRSGPPPAVAQGKLRNRRLERSPVRRNWG